MQDTAKDAREPPRRWGRRSTEEDRLSAAIAEFDIEMQRRSSATGPWKASAQQHRDRARAELYRRRYGSGWLSIKAARRDLVDGFNWPEVVIESDRLAIEAKEKLNNWRGPAVEALLDRAWMRAASEVRLPDAVVIAVVPTTSKPDGSQHEDLRRRIEQALNDPRDKTADLAEGQRRLKEARRVFDEHEDNTWWKIDLLRRQVSGAGVVLLLLLLVTYGALWIPQVTSLGLPSLSDPVLVGIVMLLGGLGAAVSGVLMPVSEDRSKRIPDLRAQYHVTWVRPLIGAAAALIVVTILRSGIAGVGIDGSAVPVAALAAGFSERILGQSVAMASAALGR